MRPVYALYGVGLHALLKAYAYICIKNNGISHEPLDYLPTRNTVVADVKSQHERVREKLLPILYSAFLEPVKACGGAVCLDLWSDNHRGISYMGVTVHFIDQNFKLNARVIANRALSPEKSKTGDYVKRVLSTILAEYQIDINSKLITFVTDRGSNIKKALENRTRHNDAPHFLHNTVGKILKAGRPQIIYSTCKKLVAHIKHAGLNSLFNPALKQALEIRWNYALGMFISVKANWNKLHEILNERNETHLLEGLNIDEISDLINLLSPFRDASVNLESRKKPTLHLCCIFYKIIGNHIQPNLNDSPIIKEAKDNCRQYYLETLMADDMLQIQHKLAIFLHPSLKMLRKMTPIEQKLVHDEVRFCSIASC